MSLVHRPRRHEPMSGALRRLERGAKLSPRAPHREDHFKRSRPSEENSGRPGWRRRVALAFALSALGLGVAGCARGSAHPPSAPPASSASAQATPARRVVDMTGRTVSLPAHVARVGTPGTSMAQLIVMLGAADKLVAVLPSVRANPWLRRIDPTIATAAAPFTPDSVDSEALLAIHPDLVLLWRGHEALRDRLGALGIPVMVFDYATPAELIRAVRLLGEALGPEETARAAQFIRDFEGKLQRVTQRTATLKPSERLRVYYASDSPLHTEGRGSMVTSWIELAGGLNVAAAAGTEGARAVALEQLLRWDPDLVVARDVSQRDALLRDPRFATLRAVRQRRVYANPKGVNAWCTRSADVALQLLWAAQLLHPDRFTDVDLPAEVQRFYADYYKYDLDRTERAAVLAGAPPPPDAAHPAPGGHR